MQTENQEMYIYNHNLTNRYPKNYRQLYPEFKRPRIGETFSHFIMSFDILPKTVLFEIHKPDGEFEYQWTDDEQLVQWANSFAHAIETGQHYNPFPTGIQFTTNTKGWKLDLLPYGYKTVDEFLNADKKQAEPVKESVEAIVETVPQTEDTGFVTFIKTIFKR